MTDINLWAAWIGILLGLASGTIQGLFFDREDWLGGYGSWPRRLMRLGHISFFGIAFLNLAYANTVWLLGPASHVPLASMLLVAGAMLMPLVCYLAAWKKPLRHLFALPVLSVLGAAFAFITGGLS
ncbi:MAG: hypothetical protein A3G24_02560 [Betaproteobacteria bacterium RIFCSPLOWO2_12_FULL_62_13]|nr:MAG: hypothetical protein A3G24_02560 [Betaproteobacteria bacterium RIFCSPLOWO2_12_FULL_62_13]